MNSWQGQFLIEIGVLPAIWQSLYDFKLSHEVGHQNNGTIYVPTSTLGLQLLPLGHASLLNSTNGSRGAWEAGSTYTTVKTVNESLKKPLHIMCIYLHMLLKVVCWFINNRLCQSLSHIQVCLPTENKIIRGMIQSLYDGTWDMYVCTVKGKVKHINLRILINRQLTPVNAIYENCVQACGSMLQKPS